MATSVGAVPSPRHRNPTKLVDFSIERILGAESDHQSKRLQRRRSTFTALQIHVLEAEFHRHRYVSPERRAGLSSFLGLSQQQVKIWFQNRRYKTKTKGEKRNRQNQTETSTPQRPIVVNPFWLLQRRFLQLTQNSQIPPNPPPNYDEMKQSE